MADFTNETFKIHDDYMTPISVWEAIKEYIPKDKIIWEAFYGDGESGKDLAKMGFDVIHENIDFFKNQRGEIIISNPPFALAKDIMYRLEKLDMPFILIMPSSKINTQYMRNTFKNKGLQIIIPQKRIQFKKMVDGIVPENYKSKCNFDCFYYCYKIGLERDIIWLDDLPDIK